MKFGWQRLPFEQAVEDVSGGNLKTLQSEFLGEGEFAVVDQGKELVAGYVNDRNLLCHSPLPVVVFGDHTRCIKYVDFPFCMGADGIKVLRPKVEADVKYLYHFLRQLRLPDGGYDRHFKYLKRAEVILPPLTEQRRIAEVLDRAETLRTKRRAALAELDTLTQSLFLDLFGDPAPNSRNLPTVSLGALGKWSSGGTPPRSREDYFTGSIPWFSSGELENMYAVESEEHVSASALRETTANAVPKGALMLGMYDTAALKASIAGVECSCNQAIAFATIDAAIAETVFVYFAIVIGREHFRRLQRGVRQKNLNLSMVREISIPKPTLQLQREFARRVAAVEKLKAVQRTSLAELDALFAALQHGAFRGEL